MRTTIVSSKDIAAAGGRMDPEYHITIAEIRAKTVQGKSLLDHLRASLNEAEARAQIERLPALTVAPLLLPLAGSGRHLAAVEMIHRVIQKLPFEALALVLGEVENLKAQATQATQRAQATENEFSTMAFLLDPSSSPAPSPSRARRSP